jgi:hypothetical protein
MTWIASLRRLRRARRRLGGNNRITRCGAIQQYEVNGYSAIELYGFATIIVSILYMEAEIPLYYGFKAFSLYKLTLVYIWYST